MALRVLLADESSTIKKVIQLSLQDYSVEVQSVNLGVDVLDVARKFQPDIIFADILLQKRSGYEVCADLKNDPALAPIPVVLMWSGFMDLDSQKLQQAQPDEKLEKPFDTEALRSIVQRLVPKIQTQSMADYLSYSDPQEEPSKIQPLVDLDRIDSQPANPETSLGAGQVELGADEFIIDETAAHHLSDVDLPEGFLLEDPTPSSSSADPVLPEEIQEDYKTVIVPEDDLSQFRVDVPKFDDERTVNYKIPTEEVDTFQFMNGSTHDTPENSSHSLPLNDQDRIEIANLVAAKILQELTSDKIEKMISAQSQSAIENAVWKVVPDIAERMIKEELDRLLRENETSP